MVQTDGKRGRGNAPEGKESQNGLKSRGGNETSRAGHLAVVGPRGETHASLFKCEEKRTHTCHPEQRSLKTIRMEKNKSPGHQQKPMQPNCKRRTPSTKDSTYKTKEGGFGYREKGEG